MHGRPCTAPPPPAAPASWDGWMDNVSGEEVVRALSPALTAVIPDAPEMACFTVSEILHCLLTSSVRLLSPSTLYVTGTGLCLLGSP